MWTLVIMLHAVSPNVPPSKGSINFNTQSLEECRQVRDQIKKVWESDKYRVTANCISKSGR
jgi:hypothetical protein